MENNSDVELIAEAYIGMIKENDVQSPKILRPLPQDIKMNDAETVHTVIQLMRQKRSDENIWEYFKIAYPNVKLTKQHFNKARAILH